MDQIAGKSMPTPTGLAAGTEGNFTEPETIALLKARHAEEISILTRSISAAGHSNKYEDLAKELEEIKVYATNLEHQHHAVLTSSSWKLTQPFREIIRRIRGQSTRPDFVPRFAKF